MPFVGSDAGDFKRFAEGGGGIVLSGSGPGIAEAAAAVVDGLLADPARLSEMGRMGRARAVERHSIEREAAAIAAVYEALWTEGSARDFRAS